MLELFRRAGRVAERCIPVVIDGEPGTGKLSLALALHARSPRADRPLALVTCTARGWRREWHGALAGDGTVVLRRLGTLADGHQLELAAELDAMAGDEGPWPIGILTAGDRQPRPELLHRLAQARLTMPPLRDRGADVTLIATDWCRRQERDEPPGPSLGPAAQEALAAHDWPGNVRELLSVLAAARINQRGTHITPHDLGLPGAGPSRRGVGSTIELRAVERDAIERALEQTGGNISHAADVLGTSRSTLYRRLRTYRIVG
jgi:DNA-binding NtrC family response regulator